jgi:hypothetical protein
MAMPTRRRRPLGAASRNRSGIEIVISPLPMLRLNTRIGGSARLLRPPSPARDAAAFGTKGLTTPALAPRARADTNAGLATVDDVRLTTRQTRVACRSLAAGGKPPPSNPRQAGALRAAPQLLAGERKQARALLLDRVKRRSLRLFCSGAVTRLGRRCLVLGRLLLNESDRAPSVAAPGRQRDRLLTRRRLERLPGRGHGGRFGSISALLVVTRLRRLAASDQSGRSVDFSDGFLIGSPALAATER